MDVRKATQARYSNQKNPIYNDKTLVNITACMAQGGELCARLHQRAYHQDWKVYRGNEENGSGDCERIWCFKKHCS